LPSPQWIQTIRPHNEVPQEQILVPESLVIENIADCPAKFDVQVDYEQDFVCEDCENKMKTLKLS
jgi:hypothetical protein